MVSNKDSNSAGSKQLYYTFNICYGNRVNSGKRLVQKQKFRLNCKRTCNFCTASFTTRKSICLLISYAPYRKFFY